MQTLELTLMQSLKILWSFLWRGWILTTPLMVLLVGAFAFIMPIPQPGEAPVPPDLSKMPLLFVLWLVMVIGMIAAQGFALRWALKTRWSDFKLIAVRPEPLPTELPAQN